MSADIHRVLRTQVMSCSSMQNPLMDKFGIYEGREIDHSPEQRQPVFRTRANYWQQGQHEWDMNEAEGRQDYGAEWIAPQWRANGFTVSTRREMQRPWFRTFTTPPVLTGSVGLSEQLG